MSIDESPIWHSLAALAEASAATSLRDRFAADDARARRYRFEVGDLIVDLSKHWIDDEVVATLIGLAEEAGVAEQIEALFRGEPINTTEQRAVLHPALRAEPDDEFTVDGVDVVADVHVVLDAMGHFSEQVRSGQWTGHTGQRIRTVINIGIGGSDLGPVMAVRALRAHIDPDIDVRFVSNVDPAHLDAALAGADPASTLIIVASKTFTTLETLANARRARAWLVEALGDDAAVARHFVALSTNADEVAAFGIDPANMFGFWDWVGGRYSMDSAIGLSLMIGIGPAAFREMLAGFRTVDLHLRSTPAHENVPILLALVGIWYRNFHNLGTHAVLPYVQDLDRFPAYLQQLDMESNGKSTRLDGSAVSYETGPIVWGEPGTNGQHAFYQLLHQGTTIVPTDLIGVLSSPSAAASQHDLLMGNLFAQAEALAFGKASAEVAADGVDPDLVPHRTFPGNRPSTVILAPEMSPSVLGQLIALYEHKVLVQGIVWGVNSFDQWGVELGKVLAGTIIDELQASTTPPLAHDSSTNALIELYRRHHGRI